MTTFDKSTFHHRPTVAPFDEGSFHVFVRSDDGDVEHYWMGDGVMVGPEQLGGAFDADPIAAWEFGDVTRLHLIGRRSAQLVDWSWDASGGPGLLGAPTVVGLPGFCLSDPEVIATSGRIDVFASSLKGQLRHWRLDAGGGWTAPELLGDSFSSSRPSVVSREPGLFDVFAIDGDPGLQRWFDGANGWRSEQRSVQDGPGTSLVGRPASASYAPQRLDVFAVRFDGTPIHWGFNGQRWFDEEIRLGLAFPATGPYRARPDPQLIEFGDERLAVLMPALPPLAAPGAPERAPELLAWVLDRQQWRGPNSLGDASRPWAAWSSAPGRVDVLSRNDDGSFSHQFFVEDPATSIDGGIGGGWDGVSLDLVEPDPPPDGFTPAVADPDLLVVRRDDMVVLGVRWTGLDLRAGAPAELVATAGAELTVIFPPQHIAEGVVAGSDPVPATQPAAPAGASCVVVGLDAGEVVPLTTVGLLDAVRRGRVVPSGAVDGRTAIEMPYRLVMSPFTEDGSAVLADHPTAAEPSPSGSVGLWNTRIAAADVPVGAPAGLLLRAVQVDTADPFPLPLPGGSRARIRREPATARIDRLRLSALGGTLAVSGSWPSFEWEHDAALGRDRRVRTATRGVLYPFGHRAEFVELTERIFQSGAEGATAHLRKRRILTVTEPVRTEPDDPELLRAFPFSAVRLDRTVVADLDAPFWLTVDLPLPEEDMLELQADRLDFEQALPLRETLDGGDMGPSPSDPPYEDMADDESDPDRARTAREYLSLLLQIDGLRAQLAVLRATSKAPVDAFFVPSVGQVPVRFPVTLIGERGDVPVALPLVFVADIDFPAGLSQPSPVVDEALRGRIADAHTTAGGDVVEVGGARIDMVRPSDGEMVATSDVCEVQRLHLVGVRHGEEFRPRLGEPVASGEGAIPAAGRWAFDMVVPEVRTLLGPGSTVADRPLRVAFTRELLEGASIPNIPFRVPDAAAAIVTDFARDSSRSGGILSPDLVLDGISRTHGPVGVEALTEQLAGNDLDPVKLLGTTATLLGFNLADLIDKAKLEAPPKIFSAFGGGPPQVRMEWHDIVLKTESGPFLTENPPDPDPDPDGQDGEDDEDDPPRSTLDLDVTIDAAGQTVTCVVENIGIALPAREDPPKLLEVRFDRIEFTQRGSGPPSLDISGIGVEFFGLLLLLKKLQEAVDLGGSGPKIDASSKGVSARYDLPVPDVTSGAFQLTGLTFHAGIDVPFDDRPVTVSLAFASREDPFNVSVLALGGGGYVDVVLDKTGLRRLELALEFGASLEVDFVVASGEVHAMGGIRMIKNDQRFALAGYLRFGGSVEVLGLVSVSIELVLTLTYDDADNSMVGRGTLVLEVDLGLWSDSVELDTGPWVLAGDDPGAGGAEPVFFDAPAFLEAGVPDGWLEYRGAFAEDALP